MTHTFYIPALSTHFHFKIRKTLCLEDWLFLASISIVHIHFSPERTASSRLAHSTTLEVELFTLQYFDKTTWASLYPIFQGRGWPTARLTTQESLRTSSLIVSFVNFTQPSVAWEESLSEGLASWSVELLWEDPTYRGQLHSLGRGPEWCEHGEIMFAFILLCC